MTTQSVPNSSQHHAGSGDIKWVIGSDSKCDKGAGATGLDPKHAKFMRVGNRCFIEDLHSKSGVFLNGERIRSRGRMEISRYDEIKLGSIPFTIDPKVFFGGGLAGLDSTELKFDVGGKAGVLCDGAYIRASSGTLTAIMGPSGAGKSVFLNLVNGYTKPTSGHVYVGQQFDVHGTGGTEAVRDFIGFVPQAEVMIPELTVLESLCYRLRLRYPDVKRDFSERLAQQVCSRLGFTGEALIEFLNKRIGSPESRGRVLSGGQRRRANIAHELVCRTQVLILDEPTSGLSSVDSDQIVDLLHDLAKQDGLTIITTIHQPSRDSFNKFDDLLLMSNGGKVAYYGPVQQAVTVLERATNKPSVNKNPAEFVLEALKGPADRDRLTRQFVSNRPSGTQSPFQPGSMPVSGQFIRPKGPGLPGRFLVRLAEWKTLVSRNFRVLLADPVHLLFSIGQVPLIALLVFMAYDKIDQDNRQYDRFARRYYALGQKLIAHEQEEKISGKKQFDADAIWAGTKSTEQAGELNHFISEASAKQRASIIFTLAVAAIWFGIMGSCKEIVTEQHVIQRECRSCIRLGPYILAKMWVQIVMVAVQTGLLSLLVVPLMLGLSLPATLHMWLVLWLAAMTSAALGLLVSGVARTYRVALTCVPLLMIPQLLFGGLLRPMATTAGITPWPQWLSFVTIQRWAFEAGVGVDLYSIKNVLCQSINLNLDPNSVRYATLKITQFNDKGLLGAFFGEHGFGNNGMAPLFIMALATIGLLVLCRIVLQKRFVRT